MLRKKMLRLMLFMTMHCMFVGAIAWGAETRYVRFPGTPFRSSTSLNAKVQRLDSREEVTWIEADKKDPDWQKVQYQGKEGYIVFSNLSRKPPMKVLTVSASGSLEGKDPQAFAKSHAATKALGGGALTYAEATNQNQIAAQVYTAELIAERITLEQIDATARSAKLTPVHEEGK